MGTMLAPFGIRFNPDSQAPFQKPASAREVWTGLLPPIPEGQQGPTHKCTIESLGE